MQILIVVPAYNEETTIDRCLEAISNQQLGTSQHQCSVVVVANGCTDKTAEKASGWVARFSEAGMHLRVLQTATAGKCHALNMAENTASPDATIYIDADVVIDPLILSQLAEALAPPTPRFATGTLLTAPMTSRTSQIYADIWLQLASLSDATKGCGLYAVNRAGRARWGAFPDIHSDDKFVRLQFEPAERVTVAATYMWPVPEGLVNLVRVRRRWCEGNRELLAKFPHSAKVEARSSARRHLISRLMFRDPIGLGVFSGIYLVSKGLAALSSPTAQVPWRRGR